MRKVIASPRIGTAVFIDVLPRKIAMLGLIIIDRTWVGRENAEGYGIRLDLVDERLRFTNRLLRLWRRPHQDIRATHEPRILRSLECLADEVRRHAFPDV